MLPDVIDVIIELMTYNKDVRFKLIFFFEYLYILNILLYLQQTINWLNGAVEKLPKQNSAGLVTATNEQCSQFLNSFHR